VNVFISHSSSDKWAARQISKELEQRGIEAFLDEKDIETGDSIDEAVDEHLAQCDELLMILSPASLSSAWVLIEVGGARALKKRLVPILLHVGANDLPAPISRGLARDINDIEKYFGEVVARSQAPRSKPRRKGLPPGRAMPLPPAKSFEIGDQVRLPARVPASHIARDGRDIGWNKEMTTLLGEVTTVVEIDPEVDGVVHVAADGGKWFWLTDWLTPAEGPDADPAEE
jgi:hypothetical protein